MKESKIGIFALCNKNQLGLIRYESIRLDKSTGKSYILYEGICLFPINRIGLKWQSKKPKPLSDKEFRRLWTVRRWRESCFSSV
jgi:hypothetical protein